ncbi:MAG: ABC transporter permease [Cyanobacteria bacterium]|nr:ABC transporter permease [Cyanobacteriota bacterium]
MNRWITASEIRLALRLIAKQPVLSLTIVLALATGVCLATIGFTLREAVLYSSLPFANGDRFVRLVMHSDAEDNVEVDLDGYHAIRDTSKSFVHLGAEGGAEFALENADGTVEPISVGLITPRSFQFLPAVPMLGRVLTAADGEPGAEPVVVLRESVWRRRFGASPSIVGQSIQLSGRALTVVGVLPDAFKFPAGGEIWVPLDEATLAGRATSLTVFGILRDGLTIAGATAELSAYSRPERPRRPGTAISMRALPFTGDDDIINTVMAGLVAVLVLALLVVASNIASLVFARTWSRSSELAVRSAIGGARSRLVGQLFAEVAILCVIASVMGLALAQLSLRVLAGMMTGIPFWMTFEPTLRTMAFVVALSFAISVVSGLLPALQVTRANLIGALHAQGRGLTPSGFGSVGRVLVIEVALSVALLNGALVMARAYASYAGEIPALPKGRVLTARLSGAQSKDTRDRMLASVRALPAVVSAGAASGLPRQHVSAGPIEIEAVDPGSPSLTGTSRVLSVSDGFLETIGGQPLMGRVFTASDYVAGAAPVAIVNQPFVDRWFNGRLPLGRRIKLLPADSGAPGLWREIIGVVPDLGMSPGDRSNAAGIYVSLLDQTPGVFVAIRSAGNPATIAGPLRKIVADIDQSTDVRAIRLLDEAGREQTSFLTAMTSAMTALGMMALLMSVVSIYALLSFMVTRRTREIGVRVALGARRGQVLTSVAGRTFALMGLGTAIGTLAGVYLAGFQSVILVSMPETGVITPSIVIAALAAASIAAAWLPTRRALAIRPSEALNSD